jgi:predicted nucleic acid-binding protein
VCQAEILSGLAIRPQGRRRQAFKAAALSMSMEDFEGHVLPFDVVAAVAYAEVFAARRLAGRPTATLS